MTAGLPGADTQCRDLLGHLAQQVFICLRCDRRINAFNDKGKLVRKARAQSQGFKDSDVYNSLAAEERRVFNDF